MVIFENELIEITFPDPNNDYFKTVYDCTVTGS